MIYAEKSTAMADNNAREKTKYIPHMEISEIINSDLCLVNQLMMLFSSKYVER